MHLLNEITSETRTVDLRVELPTELAAEIEEIHRSDPEVIAGILQYGATRRAMFEYLLAHSDEASGSDWARS